MAHIVYEIPFILRAIHLSHHTFAISLAVAPFTLVDSSILKLHRALFNALWLLLDVASNSDFYAFD